VVELEAGRWVVLALRREFGGLVGTTRILLLAFSAREGGDRVKVRVDERRNRAGEDESRRW